MGFWVALAGTAVSAAFAVKYGLSVRDINSQLDQYRRFPCPGSDTGICDVQNNPAPPLTTDQLARSHSLTEQGNQDQLLQWVFVGLTGAFAIAGGVLLYKGFLASEGGTQSASNHGLRLFPTATRSSGGIIAEFEF